MSFYQMCTSAQIHTLSNPYGRMPGGDRCRQYLRKHPGLCHQILRLNVPFTLVQLIDTIVLRQRTLRKAFLSKIKHFKFLTKPHVSGSKKSFVGFCLFVVKLRSSGGALFRIL